MESSVNSLQGYDRIDALGRLALAANEFAPEKEARFLAELTEYANSFELIKDRTAGYIDIAHVNVKLKNNTVAQEYLTKAQALIDEHEPKLSALQYLKLASAYYNKGQYDEAERVSNQCAEAARGRIDNVVKARCYNTAAATHLIVRSASKAIPYLEKANEVLSADNNDEQLVRVIQNYAVVYSQLGDKEKALSYNFRALAISERIGHVSGVLKILNNIAAVYVQMEQYEESVKYLERSVALAEELETKDTLILATTNSNLGIALKMNKRFAEAEQAFLVSVEKARDGKNRYLETRGLLYLGEVLKDQERFDQAKTTLEKVLEMAKELDKAAITVRTMHALGELYSLIGNTEEAESLLKKALDSSQDNNLKRNTVSILESLSNHYYRVGQHSLAYQILKDYSDLKNEQYQENLNSKVTKFQTVFELGRKEKEIEALKSKEALRELESKKDEEIQRWLYACLGVLVLSTVVLVNRFRESVRANQIIQDKNSALMDAQEKLETLALTDPLTKIKNRRAILNFMAAEIDKVRVTGQGFSVVLMDVDHFKAFNDTYGHDCGDFVLVEIARLLSTSLRDSDGLARWGGEEFLLVLPETEINAATARANHLNRMIAENAFRFQGTGDNLLELKVTVTMGVSELDIDKLNITETIKVADDRLYEGKKAGRNCVVGQVLEEDLPTG